MSAKLYWMTHKTSLQDIDPKDTPLVLFITFSIMIKAPTSLTEWQDERTAPRLWNYCFATLRGGHKGLFRDKGIIYFITVLDWSGIGRTFLQRKSTTYCIGRAWLIHDSWVDRQKPFHAAPRMITPTHIVMTRGFQKSHAWGMRNRLFFPSVGGKSNCPQL